MDSSARPRRRWFAFSLRAFLVLIAVAALPLGIWTSRANQQRRAVERLNTVHGTVRYDYEEKFDEHGPPRLAWLRKLLGIHYFDTAVSAWYFGIAAREEDLAIVKELPGVRWVQIEQSNLTGKGLELLQDATHVTRISIGNTSGTDATLAILGRMPRLESITVGQILPNNKVTDDGLAHLVKLSNLRNLELNNCPVTDAGLVHLEGLQKLERLTIHDSNVTDIALDRLHNRLPRCEISSGPRRNPVIRSPLASP